LGTKTTRDKRGVSDWLPYVVVHTKMLSIFVVRQHPAFTALHCFTARR